MKDKTIKIVIKITLTILVLILREQKINTEKIATNKAGRRPIMLLKTKLNHTAVANKNPAIKCLIFIIHFPGFGNKFINFGDAINMK